MRPRRRLKVLRLGSLFTSLTAGFILLTAVNLPDLSWLCLGDLTCCPSPSIASQILFHFSSLLFDLRQTSRTSPFRHCPYFLLGDGQEGAGPHRDLWNYTTFCPYQHHHRRAGINHEYIVYSNHQPRPNPNIRKPSKCCGRRASRPRSP